MIQVIQQTAEYDPDQNQTGVTKIAIEKTPMRDCLKDDCAAWQDGHCTYKP